MSDITDPINGIPLNSSILDSSLSRVTITSLDSYGNLSGDSELFWGELNRINSCEIGYGSINCNVLCFPYNEPHIRAKQCESSIYLNPRLSKSLITSSTSFWVIANIESIGSSKYDIEYFQSIEISDYYILSIYNLINGGLYTRYWDNIWFVGNASKIEIASEINYQWGVDAAITDFGTNYISIRWEGKIKPPYNETYTFYLFSDDGSRLWIDKQLIIDNWYQCCNESWGSTNLSSNTYHDIIIEYKQIRGDAYIELRWSSQSILKSIIPSKYLYYQQELKTINNEQHTIYISPGNVSYQQTFVNDKTPFKNNIAGINNSIYVTTTDAFGHILNTDNAIFNMTNLDGMITTQEWQGNGIYKITFMSTINTNISNNNNSYFLFYIKLNNYNILQSPYKIFVKPSITSPLNCTLSGNGLISSIAGYTSFWNITTYDIYGNEKQSDDDIITIRFYGIAAGHGSVEYLINGKGIYQVSYTLIKSGIYIPEITINDVILPYSQQINVTSGIIHAPSCNIFNIQQLNKTLKAGYNEYIIIQSRDQFGNALSTTSDNFVVNIISDENLKINYTILSIGNGQYNLTFIPKIIGTYNVNILLNNQTNIYDSPYILNIIPGDPYGSTSYVINGDGDGHNIAKSNVETYFIVQLCDLFNNNITDLTDYYNENENIFDLSILSCTNINITISCNLNNCSYTPIQSGSCLIYITISGINIINSPFSVSISAGDISADDSFLINDVTNNEMVGEIQTFIIQTQDLNGNNLTNGGHTFVATLIDENEIYSDINGEIIDNTDGTYKINYVTEIANNYDILNVKLINIGGLLANYYSDYSFTNIDIINNGKNIIDNQISFDWGYGSPLNNAQYSDYFSIQWIGYLYPPYSETYTIYLSIYGGSGIELYLDNDLIIDQFDPSEGESDPFIIIQLTANTFYDILINFREQTGKAKLSMEWESASIDRQIISSDYLYYIKDVGNENITILPSNTQPSNCDIYGDGLFEAIAGNITTLTIITKDNYANIQTNAGNQETNFSLYLIDDNDNKINGSVRNSGNNGNDGKYFGEYIVKNTSKIYQLYILFNGINIASSPYTISVNPGNLSMIESSAILTDGRCGELQTFSLFVRDHESNLINDRDLTISFLLTNLENSAQTFTTTNITDHKNGIYTISYNITISGQYNPEITINGLILNTITSIINISEAIASSSKSYIIGWEYGAIGTISTSSNIQKIVQLIDIYSNKITIQNGYNFYVILRNSSDSIIDYGIITGDINGTYLINFTTPSSSDIYYLDVLLASGDINNADGLTGEYYNNRWLYDSPIDTVIDTNLSLNWYNGLITSTAKNYISIRWTGYIKPLYAETYNFIISSDDGSRLYVDNQLIFDEFLSDAGTFNGNFTFNMEDLLYPIKIEYRENTGNANITLQWQSPSQSLEIIPQQYLFSSASDIKSSPFTLNVN